jgi:hypothetical protein
MRVAFTTSYPVVDQNACILHDDSPPPHVAYLVTFPSNAAVWVCGFDVLVNDVPAPLPFNVIDNAS